MRSEISALERQGWNLLKQEGRGGGKKGGHIIQGHNLVEEIERAVGVAGIWRIGRGGDVELLLLNEDENGTELGFGQILCLQRTGGEGAVMRRALGEGMKNPTIRQ